MNPGDCQWVVAGRSSRSTSAKHRVDRLAAGGGAGGSAAAHLPGPRWAEHREQLDVAEVVGDPVGHPAGVAPVGLRIHVAGRSAVGGRVVSHVVGGS